MVLSKDFYTTLIDVNGFQIYITESLNPLITFEEVHIFFKGKPIGFKNCYIFGTASVENKNEIEICFLYKEKAYYFIYNSLKRKYREINKEESAYEKALKVTENIHDSNTELVYSTKK